MLTYELFELAKIHNEMKTAIVSHNDLDGAGPIIIGKNYFSDVKYFTVANQAVDKVVKLVLFSPEYEDRELILITDCSVTDQELINYINAENSRDKRRILLFDHHGTALKLNHYDWAHVTQIEGVSGTQLFWQFVQEEVCKELGTQVFLQLDNLVNKISDYDTWQWIPEKKNDRECYLLSDLFSNTGIEYFISKYTGKAWDLYHEFEIFNDQDKALMADSERKMEYLIWPAVQKSARIMDVDFSYQTDKGSLVTSPRKVKCVTVATAIGELAERLYEDGIDFILFFYHDSVSVRSRTDEIDLGLWSKHMGNGGGHKRSAGFQLNKDNIYLYTNYINKKFE